MSSLGKHWKLSEATKKKNGKILKNAWIKRKEKGLGLAWNKGNHIRCNTGRTHFKKGRLPWNKGMNLSKNHIKKLSMAHIGWKPSPEWIRKQRLRIRENSPSWKGGKSFEPYSIDWTQSLKRGIRQRDQYTCQICGKEPAVYIHHIDYDKKNCNPDNLITLCQNCHSKTNHNRDYWIDYFKNSCSK